MDPNEALRVIREHYKHVTVDGMLLNWHQADTMCEALEALDDWIKGGGFLPDDWSQPR